MSEPTPDTAIAAVLSLDIDNATHEEVAALLRPIVPLLPPVREWDEDNMWTPTEGACAAAKQFLEDHATLAGRQPSWDGCERLYDIRDRLRGAQARHRELCVEIALGEFPGYIVRARSRHGDHAVYVWREKDPSAPGAPLLTVNGSVTRRELVLAIHACEQGYARGKSHGVDSVRRPILDALGLE